MKISKKTGLEKVEYNNHNGVATLDVIINDGEAMKYHVDAFKDMGYVVSNPTSNSYQLKNLHLRNVVQNRLLILDQQTENGVLQIDYYPEVPEIITEYISLRDYD